MTTMTTLDQIEALRSYAAMLIAQQPNPPPMLQIRADTLLDLIGMLPAQAAAPQAHEAANDSDWDVTKAWCRHCRDVTDHHDGSVCMKCMDGVLPPQPKPMMACPRCRGAGIIEGMLSFEACPQCKGTGKYV